MIDNQEYLEEGELKMVPEEQRRAVILRKLGQGGKRLTYLFEQKFEKN